MISHWDERFLEMARLVSTWSKDPSTKAGAVLVDQRRRVISVGFNGLPQGISDTNERLNNRELKYHMVVHCEHNALIFAERSIRGSILYTWPFMSCSVCAAMMIQAGISRHVAPFSDNPRWQESFKLATEILSEAGVVLDLMP